MAQLRREAIADAGRSHGVISVGRLEQLGVDRHRARRWTGEGWIEERHPGVLVLAGHEGPRTDALAAVRACGPFARAAGASASTLWEMQEAEDGLPVVVVPRGRCAPRADIDVRLTRSLPAADVTHHHGIPITRPTRTLVDLCRDHDEVQVERALHAALAGGRIGEATLRARLEHVRGHRGAAALKPMLLAASEGFTRSEAERLLREIVVAARLGRPRFNLKLLGRERDAVWEREQVVVEVHGHRWHRSGSVFEDDVVRAMELETAGWRVVQVTYRLLRDHPLAVAARLGRVLELPPLGRLAPRR